MDDKNNRRKKRVTVPELYRKAARILKSADEHKGSLKNLIYSSGYRDIKPLYALVAESCKHRNVLEELLKVTPGLNGEPPLIDSNLAKILITELLWGKGYLKPENAHAIRKILDIQKDIKKHFNRLSSQQDSGKEDTVKVPRYVRVNTLLSTVEDICRRLTEKGWKQIILKKKATYSDFIEKIATLVETEFVIDYHLNYLLVFHPGAQFHDDSLLHEGHILLQDKASCMSAAALEPPDNLHGKIMDACAAPGMKTSLLAALSKNQNPIIAIERDGKRCKTLRQTLEKAKAKSVTVQKTDFLTVDPTQYQDVKYILVDPSCSGSGIVNKLDTGEDRSNNQRLNKLSSLQCRLIEHAASFPNVERIVYSTCSVYVQENEAVVRRVLSKIGTCFRLEKALPTWLRRGVDEHDLPNDVLGEFCVRAEPKDDLTNGFFIALFVRR